MPLTARGTDPSGYTAPRRYVQLVLRGDALRCPHDHKITDVLLTQDGLVRCKYRWPTHAGHAPGECGQLLYLWAGVDGLATDGAKGVLAIGIQADELRQLDRKGISPFDVLKILGLRR